MQDYKKLRVWHVAHRLAVRILEAFPERAARKIPGLRAQVIRAATSVASNIAEGCGRPTRTEFLHAVEIALGSLNETESQLLLARDGRVFDRDVYDDLQHDVDLCRRMAVSLTRTLQRRIAEDEATRIERRAPNPDSVPATPRRD